MARADQPTFNFVIAENEDFWIERLEKCFKEELLAWGVRKSNQFVFDPDKHLHRCMSVERFKKVVEPLLKRGELVYATLDLGMPFQDGQKPSDDAGHQLVKWCLKQEEALPKCSERFDYSIVSANSELIDEILGHEDIRPLLNKFNRNVTKIRKGDGGSGLSGMLPLTKVWDEVQSFIRRHISYCTFETYLGKDRTTGKDRTESQMLWLGEDAQLKRLFVKADEIAGKPAGGLYLIFADTGGYEEDWFRLCCRFRGINKPVVLNCRNETAVNRSDWDELVSNPPEALLLSRVDHAPINGFDLMGALESEPNFLKTDLGKRLVFIQFPYFTRQSETTNASRLHPEAAKFLDACLEKFFKHKPPFESGGNFAYANNDNFILFPKYSTVKSADVIRNTIAFHVREYQELYKLVNTPLDSEVFEVLCEIPWDKDEGLKGEDGGGGLFRLRMDLKGAFKKAAETKRPPGCLISAEDFDQGKILKNFFDGELGFRVRAKRYYHILELPRDDFVPPEMLGAGLCAVLTGKPFFQGATIAEVLEKVRLDSAAGNQHSNHAHLPKELAKLVKQHLAKTLEDAARSVADLEKEFYRVALSYAQPLERFQGLEMVHTLLVGLKRLIDLHGELEKKNLQPCNDDLPSVRYEALKQVYLLLEKIFKGADEHRKKTELFRAKLFDAHWELDYPGLQESDAWDAVGRIRFGWPFDALKLHWSICEYLRHSGVSPDLSPDFERFTVNHPDLKDKWHSICQLTKELTTEWNERDRQRRSAERYVREEHALPTAVLLEPLPEGALHDPLLAPLHSFVLFNAWLALCENRYVFASHFKKPAMIDSFIAGTTDKKCIEIIFQYLESLNAKDGPSQDSRMHRSLFRHWVPSWPHQKKERCQTDALRLVRQFAELVQTFELPDYNKADMKMFADMLAESVRNEASRPGHFPNLLFLDAWRNIRNKDKNNPNPAFIKAVLPFLHDILRRLILGTTCEFRLGNVEDGSKHVKLWTRHGFEEAELQSEPRIPDKLTWVIVNAHSPFHALFPIGDVMRIEPNNGASVYANSHHDKWDNLTFTGMNQEIAGGLLATNTPWLRTEEEIRKIFGSGDAITPATPESETQE